MIPGTTRRSWRVNGDHRKLETQSLLSCNFERQRAAQHATDILLNKDLPLKYHGPCFTKSSKFSPLDVDKRFRGREKEAAQLQIPELRP